MDPSGNNAWVAVIVPWFKKTSQRLRLVTMSLGAREYAFLNGQIHDALSSRLTKCQFNYSCLRGHTRQVTITKGRTTLWKIQFVMKMFASLYLPSIEQHLLCQAVGPQPHQMDWVRSNTLQSLLQRKKMSLVNGWPPYSCRRGNVYSWRRERARSWTWGKRRRVKWETERWI